MLERIFLGGGLADIGPPYWIARLSGASHQSANSVAVDVNGDVYLCGYSSLNSGEAVISKYSAAGAIQWQRSLGSSTASDNATSIAVDGSGNVYICGVARVSSTDGFMIAKYNTSGAIQWQRRLSTTSNINGQGIALDASGNVYVCGNNGSESVIAKYNNSGAIQWQRNLSSSVVNKIATDSSGNVYACGYQVVGVLYFYIVKYNTSGVIQWQRRLGDPSGSSFGTAISVDSSGDVYVCGNSSTSSISGAVIAKYTSSGSMLWTRYVSGSGAVDAFTSIIVDSIGNVYACGRKNVPNYYFRIVKYNTSGVIQWQRLLGSSGADSSSGTGVSVDRSGNIYVCGYLSRTFDEFLFAKLPSNGSLTGTYAVGGYNISYSTASYSEAAAGLTDYSGLSTDSAGTLTSSTSTLTDAATTFTSSVATL